MNVLIAYSAEQIGTEENPLHPNLRPSGTYNDGTQDWWLYLCTEILTADRVIGAWNSDGTVLVTATDEDGNPTAWYPIHPDYEAYIRPLGNADGVATNSLDYHHWAGGEQRYLQEEVAPNTVPFYPAEDQPIVLNMERFYYDVSPWEGHAWRATIEFSDPSRPPDARAVGIYDSGWNYLYTTGAFVETDTGEVDENGDPIMKWQSETPAGRATADPEPVYYALLLGSAQEGRMVLDVSQQSRTDFYWEHDQGAPAGATWVDSGVTVTGMAGTATSVSDTAPFVTGQPVRIDGVEFSITSIGGGWLALDPYAISPTGAAVEVVGTRVTHDTFPVTHDGEPVTHG